MSKKSNVKENHAIDGDAVPDNALEALARMLYPAMLYPAMLAFFESEEGQREFAEWQAHREKAGTPTGVKKPVGNSKRSA